MKNAKRKVLITGGSSFIGRHLTSSLSDKNYEITSIYHQHLPEPMPGVFPVCSDFSSPDLILAPLRDIGTVYHLAWAFNLKGQQDSNSKADGGVKPLNLSITENIVQAMEKLGTQRIVFLSAIGARKHATHPFLREKYLAELCILNSNIPEKIIIRTAPVCGGEGTSDRMIRAIEKLLQTPVFFPIPDSEKKMSPVHIDYLTDFLLKIDGFDLKNYRTVLYELFGSETYTVRQLFMNLAEKRGIKSKISMGGVLGDSLSPLFDRVKKEEKDFLRVRDYCALTADSDKYVNQENPFNGLISKKVDGFEKVIAP
jgi:nucleoside-diphosphate-sugar epimerase